jgi:hypothetical protein
LRPIADGHGRLAYEPTMMVALLLCTFRARVALIAAIGRACAKESITMSTAVAPFYAMISGGGDDNG